VSLFHPTPSGPDYFDIWGLCLHAQMLFQLFPSHRFPVAQRILFRRRRGSSMRSNLRFRMAD
jgi:hypothetical protein